MKGPYVSGEVGAGIKAIILYEYDQSKTKEAMEYVGSRLAKYFGVPGFTYSVNIWLEVNEALKMIGLAWKSGRGEQRAQIEWPGLSI